MALQTSGLITLQDLQDEFGGSDPIKMSQFYRGGTLVPDFSLNNSVPTSGNIKLSDFYGASKGIEVSYTLIGAGGGGGYGVDNGAGTGSSGAGSKTTLVKDSVTLVDAPGGAGGVNGRDNGTGTGGNGADSTFSTSTGGAGGGANAAGGAGSQGGGGGGGGGDAPSRYDRSGGAGGGGAAGTTRTGVFFTGPGSYTLNTGTGGTSSGGNYAGGKGGNGYAKITQPATRRDEGTNTNLTIDTIFNPTSGNGVSTTGIIYNQPIIGAPLTNTWSRFWDYMYVNRTDENDTNNPYSVTEMGNYDKQGNGRLYIAHKNDYTGSTFYNDTPIAAIQILDQPGTSVLHNWWFNTANSWQTYTAGYQAGSSTAKPGTAPGSLSNNWATVGTGYSTTRFQLRSSTSSSRTGATGGINNPGTTPMTLGQETVGQNSSTNFLFREVSGTNPRYSFNYCRSPVINWQPGYRIRMAYIIGNRSASTYDADDTLFAAIV